MVLKTKKRKVAIPKIKIDKNGKRYIMIGKKKVLIDKGISERELIKYIIKHLAKPRRRRTVGERPSKTIPGPNANVLAQEVYKAKFEGSKAEQEFIKKMNQDILAKVGSR